MYLLEHIARWAQVDRATFFAALGNITSLGIGPVTAVLVATHFSPELQGYYYTFGSLIALQFLIELGFGQAIIQFASHEWAKLNIGKNGRIYGDSVALSRLISLGHISFKWYGLCSGLVILTLVPGGYLFFHQSTDAGITWMWPWVTACIAIALNLLIMPIFYLLQGCNEVSPYWFYRLIQQLIYAFALWLSIILGGDLWTWSISMVCCITWSIGFLLNRYRGFLASFHSLATEARISWRREIWPIQWKIAISWLTAYLTTFFFAPILFKFSGAIVAGQMGITASLNSVLLAISSNWVATKAPYFGILISRRKYRELDDLFRKNFFKSLLTICFGAAIIWMMVYLLYKHQHFLSSRILPPLPTALFILATAFNSITANLSIYLRAHKEEPLAKTYLISAFLCIGFSILLGSRLGAVGITAAYLGTVLLFQLPSSLHTFLRCRSEWHNEG